MLLGSGSFLRAEADVDALVRVLCDAHAVGPWLRAAPVDDVVQCAQSLLPVGCVAVIALYVFSFFE